MKKTRKAGSKAKAPKKKPPAKKAAKKTVKKKRPAGPVRAKSRSGARVEKSALLREFLAAGADFEALSKILRDFGVKRLRPSKHKRPR